MVRPSPSGWKRPERTGGINRENLSRSFLMDIPATSGNYVIVAAPGGAFAFDQKSLGQFHLPAGIYLYCGSAHGPGGLKARIGRHLKRNTRKFWHFDHLKDHVRILQVWWDVDRDNRECEILQALLKIEGAQIPIKGFGSSDCRRGCPAHLVWLPPGSDLRSVSAKLRKSWAAFTQWDADLVEID